MATVQVRMDVDMVAHDRIFSQVEQAIENVAGEASAYMKPVDIRDTVRAIYIATKYGEWISDNWYGVNVGDVPITWLSTYEFEFTMDSSDAIVFKLTHGGV